MSVVVPIRAASPAADGGLAAVETVIAPSISRIMPRHIAFTILMPVLIHISSVPIIPLVQGPGI